MANLTKIIIALIAGLTAGYLVGVQLAEAPGGDLRVEDENQPPAETAGLIVGDYTIAVLDQPPGNSVIVSKVVAKNVSWVVIREDRDGELGNILGAQRVQPGEHVNIRVELLRGTVEAGKYYAMIYSDNGDMIFDHRAGDEPRRDPLGNMIKADFEARSGRELPGGVSI